MKKMGRKELLRKLQELEFAAVDINLYLDTHPENQQALMDYNSISQQLLEHKQIFEMNYGPLINFGFSPSKYPWAWVNEPWPWQE
ncbi:spore coat protein JB [Desulfonispora thiosulfatigenes DSM 11270]|uniref:Spore coat protein JB n=1 Tax=Desulfonispora thiosulfatigenes DSM 11270 TaxID=656914 RepID=A0A1W1VGW7_DESTI|nr:spore coat protein CotJB [Desulfonispora thiosulfatigenes]SMB92556.1 spore coat protein JB [Desulfonispora thiosulfatigenes DSM 11270]